MSKRNVGVLGEEEVRKKVRCPNCGRELMLLPPSYPLVDVQCTGCLFRAQIKTQLTKPRDTIFGAGWDILEKTLKAGYQIPPLIVNFKSKNKQQIRFYTFIPKRNIRKRILSRTAKRANYKMFNYVGLSKLPYFILYES
jgi:DNA-directed RNA polymerase subunit RPC12/RpoP